MLARALGGVEDAAAPQEHVAPRPIARAAADPSGQRDEPWQPARTVRRTLHEHSGGAAAGAPGPPARRGAGRGAGRDVGRASLLPGELKALAGLGGGAAEPATALSTARRLRQAELDSTGIVARVEAPLTTGSQVVPPWGDSRTGEDEDPEDRRRQPRQRPPAQQAVEVDAALGAGSRPSHPSRERRVWELQTWSGDAPNAVSLARGEVGCAPGPMMDEHA